MLSIIISSSNSDLLKDVTKNIEETIGIKYEIIATDNSAGSKGLCEVYNEGVQKAKYRLLCFMHEDISIKTLNWGWKVAELFNKTPQLGLLGIAGADYKTLAPSGWSMYMLRQENLFMNIIQNFKFSEHQTKHDCINHSSRLVPVTSVDGVWFCTTKEIAQEFPFDQQMLKGFHCYDLDFSLQVNTKYQVAVTFDILLEHYSEGNYNKSWVEDTISLHQKWKEKLPVNLSKMNKKEIQELEIDSLKSFIHFLILHKFPLIRIVNILNKSGLDRVIGLRQFFILHFAALFYIIKWNIAGKNILYNKIYSN